MKKTDLQKLNIPKKSGVYFFKDLKGKVLYIGKATVLAERVKSYFSKDLINTRGVHILDMVTLAKTLSWQETDSALEALLLETELIKKYKPLYNTKEKDDKSYNCVVITKEDFPKVLLVRQKDLDTKNKIFTNKKIGEINKKYDTFYGPYPSGSAIKEALRIIRKIFPFSDNYSSKKDNYEFYRQIGLAPDIKNTAAKSLYKDNIRNIKRFFSGKKKDILRDLKKRMSTLAKAQRFEEAEVIKRTIYSLEHINDIALMKRDFDTFVSDSIEKAVRIEAYDISHISGKNMVGVMVVLENGHPAKSEYKKFNIKSVSSSNDPAALLEILQRRFTHSEWKAPDIVVVDGGEIQKKVLEVVKTETGRGFSCVSVVKDERHKPKDILGDKEIVKKYRYEILLANNESHRFAIGFHKQKRSKTLNTRR
ncbi:MAG: GIY-YIG nuclease family protein [Candidatus Paceibacterota bacterium]